MPVLPGGEPVSSQGVSCSWGDVTMTATSVQFQQAAAAEYDITGFDARITADPGNTCHFLVTKSVDYAVIEPGELNVDFIANMSALGLTSKIGLSKLVTFKQQPSSGGSALIQSAPSFNITATAFLTSISLNAQVGQFITGNCTFKLSDR